MSRIRLLGAALIVTLAVLAASAYAIAASASPATTTATTVKVTMSEFKFVLSKKTVPHGKVIFNLVNKGTVSHDFWIGGKKSKLIRKGKTGQLIVLSLAAGKRPYKCTVLGHAKLGMKGVLRVT
jgi:plastocyanin